MGRKVKRVKSTFRNEVRPGTLWSCRFNDTFYDYEQQCYRFMQPEQLILILSIKKFEWLNDEMVECYHQEDGIVFLKSFEDLAHNYNKIS